MVPAVDKTLKESSFNILTTWFAAVDSRLATQFVFEEIDEILFNNNNEQSSQLSINSFIKMLGEQYLVDNGVDLSYDKCLMSRP